MNKLHIFICLLCSFLMALSCKYEAPESKENLLPALEYELSTPQNGTPEAHPLLIVLHGRGSNAANSMQWASQLGNDWLVVTAQGPYKMAEDKYQWYPLELRGSERIYEYAAVQESKQHVVQLINSLCKKHSIQKDKIVLMGFSQGAFMASVLALEEPELFAAIGILSGGIPVEAKKGKSLDPKWKNLDLFISHGRQDAVLDYNAAQTDANFLAELDIKVTARWYDSGHTISGQNFQDLYGWLEGIRIK